MDWGFIETEAGTDIISVSSAWAVTIASSVETIVDLTTTGNTIIGNSAAADTLTVNAATTSTGTITVWVDGTGKDVKFFWDTAWAYCLWDESADDLILAWAAGLSVAWATTMTGTLTVWVDGTGLDVKFFWDTAGAYMLRDQSEDDLVLAWAAGLSVAGATTMTGTLTTWVDGTGVDVKFYSATASNSWLWDESADKVVQTFTTDSVSTVEPHTITSTLSGVGVTGGRFKHALTINAAAGSYTNAIKWDVTYWASGRTTGLGSSVLAEMTLSAGTTSGTYAPLEVELNLGSNSPIGTDTSLAFFSTNGTATAFLAGGHLMTFNGLGAASSATNIFHTTGTVSATHGLRINIDGVNYDILLKASTYA